MRKNQRVISVYFWTPRRGDALHVLIDAEDRNSLERETFAREFVVAGGRMTTFNAVKIGLEVLKVICGRALPAGWSIQSDLPPHE
mgnify:CR=1 FL=1